MAAQGVGGQERVAGAAFEVALDHAADVAGWRVAARRLLAAGIAPERVLWSVGARQPGLFERPLPPLPDDPPACRVPRHLVRLVEQAALHADPERFALLYRLLWRVTHGERAILLRHGPAAGRDAAVARVAAMAAAVRRSAHRLRHLARFREVAAADGAWLVGWHEPEHHVLRPVAAQLATTFADRRWLLATPSEIALADADGLRFLPGPQRCPVPPPGAGGAAWQAFLARLRPGAVALPPDAAPVGVGSTVLLVTARPQAEQAVAGRELTARALRDAGLVADRLAWTDARAGGRPAPRPGLIVALGAAAAETVLRRRIFLPLERGRIMALAEGGRLLVTADPVTIAALPDAMAQGREFRRLVADLLLAVPYQRRIAA